jgi:hypothetical protein
LTGRFEEATKHADEARELFGAPDAADAVTSVESLLADFRDAAGG